MDCYTEEGYEFQGTGFNDGCAKWTRDTLEQANITFPEKVNEYLSEILAYNTSKHR